MLHAENNEKPGKKIFLGREFFSTVIFVFFLESKDANG